MIRALVQSAGILFETTTKLGEQNLDFSPVDVQSEFAPGRSKLFLMFRAEVETGFKSAPSSSSSSSLQDAKANIADSAAFLPKPGCATDFELFADSRAVLQLRVGKESREPARAAFGRFSGTESADCSKCITAFARLVRASQRVLLFANKRGSQRH